MTISYNALLFAITQYIKDIFKQCYYTDEQIEIFKQNNEMRNNLKTVNNVGEKDKLKKNIKHIDNWYGMADMTNPQYLINDRDIYLLSKSINHIINRYFSKITRLSGYLIDVDTIYNNLNISICWSLPSGLHITQSYISVKSASRKPFTFIKSSFKLKVSIKNKLNKSKQKIALMSNLIHSLDSASLVLLYNRFYSTHKPIVHFYAIYNCFRITNNKVDSWINFLKTVCLTIYPEDNYLYKFDLDIINFILYHYSKDCIYESDKKKYIIYDTEYILPDIKEELGKTYLVQCLKTQLKIANI